MKKTPVIVALVVCSVFVMTEAFSQYTRKTLIAHRGASAYAPEHTLDAYRLAIEQGADYVEQDLQITKDGVLVCLHDTTLERTTDVEAVFPSRFVVETIRGKQVRRWNVSDFTLAEIKRLDAGSWFDAKFKGARVLTWQEAIDFIRGKAGLYPETKAPEVYGQRGFDMEKLVMDMLSKNKLSAPRADPRTPVIIQSFSAESLQRLRKYGSELPHLLLIGDARSEWLSPEGLGKTAVFANGIGPAKEVVDQKPEIVKSAHALGLSVTLYTFRSAATGNFGSVREEMAHFLHGLGVDAVFTDNPDQFPRR